MNWFSISNGMIKIGCVEFPEVFAVLWFLVVFYLVAGFVLHVGRWAGIRIYSRKRDPFNYWFDCSFYIGITIVLTFWWKQLLILAISR